MRTNPILIVFVQRPWWLGGLSEVRVLEVQGLLKLFLLLLGGAGGVLMTGLVAGTMRIV